MPPLIETAFQLPGSGHTSDVRYDMMQLQVHLHQRFLHVLYVGCCVFHQAFAQA
jgi:hypothetical protein